MITDDATNDMALR
jgi:hypothetical protein